LPQGQTYVHTLFQNINVLAHELQVLFGGKCCQIGVKDFGQCLRLDLCLPTPHSRLFQPGGEFQGISKVMQRMVSLLEG